MRAYIRISGIFFRPQTFNPSVLIMAANAHNFISRESALNAIAVNPAAEYHSFTSSALWIPYGHPGVYGGQLVAQAIHSATKCVDTAYALNVCLINSSHRNALLK